MVAGKPGASMRLVVKTCVGERLARLEKTRVSYVSRYRKLDPSCRDAYSFCGAAANSLATYCLEPQISLQLHFYICWRANMEALVCSSPSCLAVCTAEIWIQVADPISYYVGVLCNRTQTVRELESMKSKPPRQTSCLDFLGRKTSRKKRTVMSRHARSSLTVGHVHRGNVGRVTSNVFNLILCSLGHEFRKVSMPLLLLVKTKVCEAVFYWTTRTPTFCAVSYSGQHDQPCPLSTLPLLLFIFRSFDKLKSESC
jgi:hypothetical protein